MGAFEELHQRRITGSLAMYDRMIFKGHFTALFKQDGARCYLWSQGVALKDFTPYAKATTAQIADRCRALVTSAGRPVISFDHVRTRNRTQRKDDLAKSIAERDGVSEGIVCLISAVEPCYSFHVRKRMTTGRLEIFRRERACLHHYLYLIDPEFGFMHIRIQGWLPYEVQVYTSTDESGWPGPSKRPASAMSATRTPSWRSTTWTLPHACASTSPTGRGPACSTPSPRW